MALSEYRANTNSQDNIVDVKRLEIEFKKDKVRAKLNFTRSRNQLLLLLEQQDMPGRKGIRDACESMDQCMEIAMEVLSKFSDFYIENKELQKNKLVVGEMEKIEEDYYESYKSARDHLDSQKEDTSSLISDMHSIALQERMNIADVTETFRKEKQVTEQNVSQEKLPEVRSLYQSSGIRDPIRETTAATSSHFQNKMMQIKVREVGASWPTGYRSNRQINRKQWVDMDQHSQRSRTVSGKSGVNESGLNPNAASFEPIESVPTPSMEQDLWRQLKPVQIPVFSGDKRTYQGWKATFLACIDSAPATPEYKLLQLRQYLSGEALQAIENLGHSATAYAAAKERLERKYGGKRRQIATYLEDLEQFPQIRPGNAKDLDQFSDLLDIAIINLEEAGHHHELGDGFLYAKLQRKLPQDMLAKYHRWIFENNIAESVGSLRTWVIHESEFQTIASETIHGFAGNIEYNTPERSAPRRNDQRSFFGELQDNRSLERKAVSCQVCGNSHRIWSCLEFIKMNVPERWDTAKRMHLCYRCLGDGHSGKSCPRSRPCGQNGCCKLHDRLLHKTDKQLVHKTEQQLSELKNTELRPTGRNYPQAEPIIMIADQITSVTEGKEPKPQTTIVTQGDCRPDVAALRTVPIVLKNGNRSLKVNALLDDASTKTYVNADIAAELGLQGKVENVTVNILNGKAETFKTMPIDIELESLTGNVSINVNAYTANRVTGHMSVMDWNGFKSRWPHLKDINFPRPSLRPVVDILIGLDCIDLHCAIEEVRGRPGEPIARLTPLGWSCIGNLGINYSDEAQHTNSTYFISDRLQIGNLSGCANQLYKTEEASFHTGTTPRLIVDDISAIKNCEIWNARGYSQYIEIEYVRESHEQEQSKSKTNLQVIMPGKYSTKSGMVIHISRKMNDVSMNETVHTSPNLQSCLLRYKWSFAAEVFGILEWYVRIGRAPAYKPFRSFLWRGSIQNHPLESKYDQKMLLVSSTALARIARYEQKTEVGKNDRPAEPSLQANVETCGKFEELDPRRKLRGDIWYANRTDFRNADIELLLMLLVSSTALARIARYEQKTEVGKNDRPAEPSLQANVETCGKFEELDPRRKLRGDIWYANRTDFRNADIELLLTLRLYRYTIAKSPVSPTVTSHENPLIDKHLYGAHGSKIQSATNVIFDLLRNTIIDYEEMMTPVIVAERLVIAWPLTYHQTLEDEIQSNIHGRECAESRKCFGTNDFIYLHRNGNRDSRRQWQQERRNRRYGEVFQFITGKLATRQWPRSLTRARCMSSSHQPPGGIEGLVKSTMKLSLSIRTRGCAN